MNRHVGLLFIDFEGGARRRVNGDAGIHSDDPLLESCVGAQCIVRMRARTIFPNCPCDVHEYRKVSASEFVPRNDIEPPVPDWKHDGWFRGTPPSTIPPMIHIGPAPSSPQS